MANLDTPILVYALEGSITGRERGVLSGQRRSISAIVLWELAKLAQLGRIGVDLNADEVVRTLSGISVWPLDLAVSLKSARLDLRGDPADEMIAATSIVHGVPLLTRDRRILSSRIVPLA